MEENLKLTEIAKRLVVHFKRFEADPEINKVNKYGQSPYYYPHAYAGKKFVYVRFVSYQGNFGLTKKDALAYLAWLDAGNEGTHWECFEDLKKKQANNGS